MAKTNAWENALMLLLFNNADAAGIGDAGGLRGSVAAGNLYISLHTADPGEAGDQTTSEAAYVNYARVAVPRSAAGFTVTANSVSPVADVVFPLSASGPETETHWGIGTAAAGAGILLYKGPIAPNIAVDVGVTPRLTTATTVTET